MLDQSFEMRLCLRNHWVAPVGFAFTVDQAIQFVVNMDTDDTCGMAVCKDGTLTSVFVMWPDSEMEDAPDYAERELAQCKPPYDFRAIFLDDKWIASNIL